MKTTINPSGALLCRTETPMSAVKVWRALKGVSQQQLAHVIGVDKARLCRIERRGINNPSIPLRLTLTGATGIPDNVLDTFSRAWLLTFEGGRLVSIEDVEEQPGGAVVTGAPKQPTNADDGGDGGQTTRPQAPKTTTPGPRRPFVIAD